MFKRLKKIVKRLAASDFWVCARCGTTNVKTALYCKECKNRRPF